MDVTIWGLALVQKATRASAQAEDHPAKAAIQRGGGSLRSECKICNILGAGFGCRGLFNQSTKGSSGKESAK